MTLIYTSKHSLNSLSTSQILWHRQRDRHAENVTGIHNAVRSNGLRRTDVLVCWAFSLCASITDLPFSFTRQTSLWTRTKRRFVDHNMITWDVRMLPTAPDKLSVCATYQCKCIKRTCMWAPRQWQPDCTRRQGIGMKANLPQPWPQLYKIIKKKSVADRGWGEMDLSLVHYGARLTGDHIWITHTVITKQLAASNWDKRQQG